MPFRNDAVGGINLVRSAIQSPNFVAGSTGWAIRRDGSAEFHGITVTGGSLVITGAGQGVFVYSGAPAFGNLIVSMASASGTDAQGNAYPTGFGVSSGTIPGTLINAGTVGTTQIANNAITNALLAATSVATGNIQNGAVTTTQIAAAAGILGTQLSASANISGSQLAAAAGIVAGQVSFTARGIGGITTSVQSTAPTGAVANDLWFDTSNGNKLNQYNGASWVAFQYGTNAIAALSITAALIAANTITAAQIAGGTITATQIAAATITGSLIAAGTITGSNIVGGTITGDLISANAIVAGLIAAGAIDGQTINAATINGNIISAADLLISGTNGGVFAYGTGGTIVQTLTTGTSWIAPAGVTSVKVECVAGGGGSGGANATSGATAGGAGGNTTFAGNAVTVTANKGGGGGAANGGGAQGTAGTGGSGSANATHNNGGAGGGGGGGGSSGGSASAGNAGGTGQGGAGGLAVAGGGPGGTAGTGNQAGFSPAATPGGGGGGGDAITGVARATGGGGGGGEYAADGAIVVTAGNTYTYAIGAAGTAGVGGGGGFAGAIGAVGQLRLTYSSSTPTLVAAIAGAVGTDPVIGSAVGPGLNLYNTSAPVKVSGVALLYAASGQPAYVNPAGLALNMSGAKLATVTTTTVTAAALTTIASGSIPANDMEIGAVYELVTYGNGTWGSTQQSLQWAVCQTSGTAIGTAPIIAAGAFAISAAFRWEATAQFVCVTTGSAGTMHGRIRGCVTQTAAALLPGTAGNNTVPFVGGDSAAVTVNTTLAVTPLIQVAWGSTTGASTITSQYNFLRRVA